MSTNLVKKQRTPIGERKGIKVSQRTRDLYEQRNRSLDKDLESRPLPPDRWANAMTRDEYFRPVEVQTTVRLDADVLAWLKAKGAGHISRVNEILRSQMLEEQLVEGAATAPSEEEGG